MRAGVCAQYKWLDRFREEGAAGLLDRSSRPHRCPHATDTAVGKQVMEHRRERWTYRQIAPHLGVAESTVGRQVERAGLHRLAELELAAGPPVPVPGTG